MTLARAFLAAALILVLGACAYMAPYQPPSTYYVMRHLHTPEGAADPGLTEEGQRHARLLADFFTEEPPATIFVSTTKRARQTAAQLAAKLGITQTLYDPRDTARPLTEVMKEQPPGTIVGPSKQVPEIEA